MIFLYHIQRTGGRSFTQSILTEFSNPWEMWMRCHGETERDEGPVIECEGKKVVPWNRNPMGVCDDFFYGWSHFPAHQIELPDHCFTVTILRDPVTRFISFYRYLRKFDYIGAVNTPGYFHIHTYLRPDILSTIEAFPKVHLYQMLHHFSPTLDVDEAVEGIGGVSYWFRMENYVNGLKGLRSLLGLKMPWKHHEDGNIPEQTEQDVREELTPKVRAQLVEIFQPEYEFLERLGAR